jgi:hypothetical protein
VQDGPLWPRVGADSRVGPKERSVSSDDIKPEGVLPVAARPRFVPETPLKAPDPATVPGAPGVPPVAATLESHFDRGLHEGSSCARRRSWPPSGCRNRRSC